MAALTCDICGGQLSMDPSGEFAVCESCGMKHTKDRIRVKVQEIFGTVKIDDTEQIREQVSNWEKLANAAYDNKNFNEAYTYYCKILEKRPDYWFATFRKGMSYAWQANLANMRTTETVGSTVDAVKQLMADPSQTDELKANGIVIMAVELYNWEQALASIINNNAREYAEKLENSANEFFQRQVLMAVLVYFNISMITEFVYINYKDKKSLESFLETVCKFGNNVLRNFTVVFSIKSSEWDNFWKTSVETTKNVGGGHIGIHERTQLKAIIKTTPENIRHWKESYSRVVRKSKMDEFWKKHPDLQEQYTQMSSKLRETSNALDLANSEYKKYQAQCNDLQTEIDGCNIKIQILETEISTLRKKMFGKKKAGSSIAIKERDLEKLRQSLADFNERLGHLQATQEEKKTAIDTLSRERQELESECNKILRANGINV